MDLRNISCFNSENMLPKEILKYHVSMLTLPSCVSYNPFPNNKTCESSLTTRYQSEISKNIYPLVFTIVKEVLLWIFSLLNIRTMNGVIPCSPPLILFYCVCVVSFCLSLFLLFCVVYFLLRYWDKFVITPNKAVELFLGS